MTGQEFRLYLLFVALAAAILGIVNMLRPRKRWLGAGAVLLGIGVMLYNGGFPLLAVGIACGLGAFCLVRDVGVRAGRLR